MFKANSERESNEINDTHGGSKNERYENYQMQNLGESDDVLHKSNRRYETYGDSIEESYEASKTKRSSEYIPYKGHVVENVYDRYESDYEEEEPEQQSNTNPSTRKQSCCIKGWLANLD